MRELIARIWLIIWTGISTGIVAVWVGRAVTQLLGIDTGTLITGIGFLALNLVLGLLLIESIRWAAKHSGWEWIK